MAKNRKKWPQLFFYKQHIYLIGFYIFYRLICFYDIQLKII